MAYTEESEEPPSPEPAARPGIDRGGSDVADVSCAGGAISRASSSATIAARSDSDNDDREANVDVIYVNSDRKTMAELVLEYGTERMADEPEDEPPPLPMKKRKTFGELSQRPDDGAQKMRRQTADGRGVYMCRDVSGPEFVSF